MQSKYFEHDSKLKAFLLKVIQRERDAAIANFSSMDICFSDTCSNSFHRKM